MKTQETIECDPPVAGKGKQMRREAIIAAARALIAQSGEAGLTMRDVAERAGVSHATPYNLFGSKQAILHAIYEEELVRFRTYFEQAASASALERVFDVIDLTTAFYQERESFFRPILKLLWQSPDSDYSARVWQPHHEFVCALVREAVDAGDLRADAPVELIGSSLLRHFRALGQEWAEGLLSLDRVRDDMGAFFGLFFTALVRDQSGAVLEGIRARYRH